MFGSDYNIFSSSFSKTLSVFYDNDSDLMKFSTSFATILDKYNALVADPFAILL